MLDINREAKQLRVADAIELPDIQPIDLTTPSGRLAS